MLSISRNISFIALALCASFMMFNTNAVNGRPVNINYVNDINRDGSINSGDITILINHISGQRVLETQEAIERCDVNRDSQIDVTDVTSLINLILGKTKPRIRLSILSLGNSYSADAYSYVPYIIQNIAPEVELTIAFLQQGGCYLERHYKEFCIQDKPYYNYASHIPGEAKWIVRDSVRLSEALAEREWDVILLQQGSLFSDQYDTYQPFLNQIIDFLDAKLNYPHTYGWLLTPAYPDGQSRLGTKTGDEMFLEIASCAHRVMEETDIDFLIPAGTGIQNARTTSLDNLGLFGHLSTDGVHLADGIPRLIENYIVTQTILNLLNNTGSIDNDFLDITYSWRRQMNIVEAYSIPVGMTEPNRVIAKRCAHAALLNPYTITTIE